MPLQMLAYARSKIEDLFSRLNLKKRPYEEKYWDQMLGLVISLQKSPRDLVRLINRLIIAIPNTKDDINVCDVIVVEAISLKYEHLRTLLYQQPELFTGRFWVTDENGHDYDWSQLIGTDKEKNKSKWIDELPSKESDRKTLIRAFKFLFPNLNETTGSGEAMLDELRIAATDRLKRYFALTALDDSVSVAEIHDLFKFPDRLEVYLDFNDETITKQLSDLRDYVGSAEISDFDKVFLILADKTNYLCMQENISKSLVDLLADILMKVLGKSESNKNDYFLKLVEDVPLGVSVALINTASSDLGLWRQGDSPIEHPLISDRSAVENARADWVKKIEGEAQHKSFLSHVNVIKIVWTWWHLIKDKRQLSDAIKKFFIDPDTMESAVSRLLPSRGRVNDVSEIAFIWSPIELKDILKRNHVNAEKYKILIEQLSQKEVIEWFKTQQAS